MLVEKIVFMRGAEFVERFGDFCFLGDGDVLPDLAAFERHFGLDRAVGIDRVAGMQQEIRLVFLHGGKGEHAAVVGIDAPALAGDIAAPQKCVAPVGRRGAEAADRRLARNVGMRQVAEADAIKNILSGGQVFQQHLCGEIALRERGDRRQSPHIAKRLGGRNLDHHLRRPVGARPHHAAIGADVAGLHAMGDLRPVAGAAEIRHGENADAGGRS